MRWMTMIRMISSTKTISSREDDRKAVLPFYDDGSMECEEWKDIPGYEGCYQASTHGRIRSVDHYVPGVNHYTGKPFSRKVPSKVLRPGRYCKSGHVSVVLGRGTNGIPVHQLVMHTFCGKTPNGMEILHSNGDPTDNRLVNLRYGTRTENILDVYRQGGRWRKLSISDVQEIRSGLDAGISGADLARRYKVSQTTISNIKKGKIYGWLK